VFFICDEYHEFATAGQNDPNGDEKFLALSREPRCIPIIATQSISSLHDALPGETWRTVLQSFRTRIFLTQTDGFSAKTPSELCGKEDRQVLQLPGFFLFALLRVRMTAFRGKSVAHKANVTTSKSYNTQSDFRFDTKTFTELKSAQAITLAHDGSSPLPPMLALSSCAASPSVLIPRTIPARRLSFPFPRTRSLRSPTTWPQQSSKRSNSTPLTT